MALFYITSTDSHGERHQLVGAWEADSPEDAIRQMLAESRTEDDGSWEAHPVKSPADIMQWEEG